MTENTAAAGAEAARGQPYYERLKRDIRQTLINKRRLDQQLASLEDQIYRAESQYLEETPHGNIIRGFDNYIKGATAAGGAGGAGARKKTNILDAERIFSRSSASFNRESSPDSLSQPSHAPTPTRDSNAPTPTSTTGNKAGGSLKRTKKGEKDDDDSESKPPKRLKMTFKQSEKD